MTGKYTKTQGGGMLKYYNAGSRKKELPLGRGAVKQYYF